MSQETLFFNDKQEKQGKKEKQGKNTKKYENKNRRKLKIGATT